MGFPFSSEKRTHGENFRRDALKTVRFVLSLIVLLLVTHAIAFFAHEYAHSFAAWALGAKANPLALNYGHATASNLLLQVDIDENVEYDPIFAAGRGSAAALIAIAGVLFGNGGLYGVSRLGLRRAVARAQRWTGLFWLLLCLMCVGNFIAYVPNRTFATHADMATGERGLGCSPWWIAIVLGVPFLVACWHFFASVLPQAAALWRELPFAPLLIAMTAVLVFTEFFGKAGWSGYGPVSHRLAAFWTYAVPVPLAWFAVARTLRALSARPT